MDLETRSGFTEVCWLPPGSGEKWVLGAIKIYDEEYVVACNPDHPPVLIKNGKVIDWPYR